MKSKPLPSQERLKELLNYDPDTGVFTWKTAVSNINVGDVAGHIKPHGYRHLGIDGNYYLAHRLAWVYMTGDDPGSLTVDHRNRVRSDNWFSNLRLATQQDQLRNKSAKGIHYSKRDRSWTAHIKLDGKKLHLGSFQCPWQAYDAYWTARKQYFGAFA